MRIGTSLLLVLGVTSIIEAVDYVPLHRFYDSNRNESLYTTLPDEIARLQKTPDYEDLGVLGWIPTTMEPGTTRLCRTRSPNGNHYFYTHKPPKLKNFELEDPIMYVYERRKPGSIPIHGCCLSGGEDMAFSPSREAIKDLVTSTRKNIGDRRRVFYSAFYVMKEDPSASPPSPTESVEVHGQVTVHGRLLGSGRIILHLEEDDDEFLGTRIEEGQFRFSKLEVPIGEHIVTIDGVGVPKKYHTSVQSRLKVKIREGENEISFELQE